MAAKDALFGLLEFMRTIQVNHIYYRPCKIILEELPRLQEYSIHALADRCFVSSSTLSRLSRDLGYASFQEFKITMIASYRYATGQQDLEQPFRSMREDVTFPEEARALNYTEYTIRGLEQICDFIKRGDAIKHVDLLRSCSRIMLFTSAGLDLIPFARKMVTCGKKISVARRPDEAVLMTKEFTFEKKDFSDSCSLITFHMPSDAENFIPFVRTIREAGGKVIIAAPKCLSIDPEPADQCFFFDSMATIGDDIIFQSYLNTLSIMF